MLESFCIWALNGMRTKKSIPLQHIRFTMSIMTRYRITRWFQKTVW
nr:MAG TPA: hypothetical protein [Caudoviricetes sp.]